MKEKVTKPRPWFPRHDGTPVITHGNWSACCEIKWVKEKNGQKALYQKFKRRVKRDWGAGCVSRSMEYDWKPVPMEEAK